MTVRVPGTMAEQERDTEASNTSPIACSDTGSSVKRERDTGQDEMCSKDLEGFCMFMPSDKEAPGEAPRRLVVVRL